VGAIRGGIHRTDLDAALVLALGIVRDAREHDDGLDVAAPHRLVQDLPGPETAVFGC
jgi:hypothetical protein